MRGRPPKPTHLHLVEGTARPSRHRARMEREPRPEGDLADPPADLPPEHAEVWRKVVRHSAKGVLKACDEGLLLAYVAAHVSHRQALDRLAALGPDGLLYRTPKGQLVPSPLLRVRDQQAAVMRMAAVELGLSPVARARLVGEERDRNDPAEEFFGG